MGGKQGGRQVSGVGDRRLRLGTVGGGALYRCQWRLQESLILGAHAQGGVAKYVGQFVVRGSALDLRARNQIRPVHIHVPELVSRQAHMLRILARSPHLALGEHDDAPISACELLGLESIGLGRLGYGGLGGGRRVRCRLGDDLGFGRLGRGG